MHESASAAVTSSSNGSPAEPGSLVRSSTAIRDAVAGSAVSSSAAGNGRNSRTWTTPTRSPAATGGPRSRPTVCAAEPITTITRSASGWPA